MAPFPATALEEILALTFLLSLELLGCPGLVEAYLRNPEGENGEAREWNLVRGEDDRQDVASIPDLDTRTRSLDRLKYVVIIGFWLSERRLGLPRSCLLADGHE